VDGKDRPRDKSGRFTVKEKGTGMFGKSKPLHVEDPGEECGAGCPVWENANPVMTGKQAEELRELTEGHGIAGQAYDLVYGDRASTYGHPRLDFRIIAKVWTGLLVDKLAEGAELDEYRVAVMMSGLKLSRLVKSPGHQDSRVDTIGYMLTMERLDEPMEDIPVFEVELDEDGRGEFKAPEGVTEANFAVTGKGPTEADVTEAESLGIPVPAYGTEPYTFPYKEDDSDTSAYSRKVIWAPNFKEAQAAFERWHAEHFTRLVPSPEDSEETSQFEEVNEDDIPEDSEETSQFEGVNPSDDEVALAQSILERRAAFHDREAQELLNRNPPSAAVTQSDLPVLPAQLEYEPPLRNEPGAEIFDFRTVPAVSVSHGHRKPPDLRKRAMRRWRRIFAVALLIPLAGGSTMIGMHGAAFFVFRSAGTGESPDSFLAENQGPGQPDAPRATVAAKVKVKVKVPPSPVVTAPDLVALSPSIKLTIPAAKHDTWAGIAELHNGSWTIVAAGTQYTAVSAATAKSFNASRSEYMSQWIILPVHPE
jgi:hypothetical protein